MLGRREDAGGPHGGCWSQFEEIGIAMRPVASTKSSNLLRRRPGESDDIGWVLPGGSEEVSDLSINMLHHERLTRVK